MDHRLSRWLRVVVAIASGLSCSASAAESSPVYPTNALAPSLQGPSVYGIRPHTAFLYALPARGKPPMRFEVVGLPTGLSVDHHTGIVSGSLQQEGTYEVLFRVSNEHGTAEKQFRIVAGEQLCLTPPMGWNSWNAVGEKVNETIVREAADALVTSGLKDAGYQYVVIDDHWEGGRDAEGHLVPNPNKFPSGIKALADYVHSKGLKLGIYSDAGEKTCGGEVGSFGFEELDAQTFAAWGLDYLKYDYCNAPDDFQEAIRRYTRMGQALRAANRSILFSICEWGPRAPWLWGRQAGGHLWRTSFDVGDMWDTPHNTHSCIGILASIDAAANLEKHAGPGGWNDPDMLVIGLGNKGFIKGGGCTSDEYQTQMAMWCMLAAPLMIGCDVRHLAPETLKLLTNPGLVELDQDELGQPTFRIARTGSTEVWKRNLAGGDWAAALLNRGEEDAEITVDWVALGLDPKKSADLRDVFTGSFLGSFRGQFKCVVRPHATVVIRSTSHR